MGEHRGRTRLGRACDASGKVTYTTRQVAKRHAKHLRSKLGFGGFYRCRHCDGWHITSKPTLRASPAGDDSP